MAHSLQHRKAAQRSGLSPACAGKHRTSGLEADDALTINPDHPMGARHTDPIAANLMRHYAKHTRHVTTAKDFDQFLQF